MATTAPTSVLTQEMLNWLGQADPTDPFIIARMNSSLGTNYVLPGTTSTTTTSTAGGTTTTAGAPIFVGGTQTPTNAILRDYTHASKVFRTDGYRNAPKFKFLFHVYFEINDAVYKLPPGSNPSLVVKTVKLPSFSITSHELNQYNRKRIVQTKIKYEPVDITFHDDNKSMIQTLWKNYYQYYYSDSSKPGVSLGKTPVNPINNFNNRTIYDDNISGDVDWGYKGESSTGALNKVPFFKTIKIFSLHAQNNYTSYILVNPIITRFDHDTHSYSESAGIMENKMTINYETVVYGSGVGTIPANSVDEVLVNYRDRGSYDQH